MCSSKMEFATASNDENIFGVRDFEIDNSLSSESQGIVYSYFTLRY